MMLAAPPADEAEASDSQRRRVAEASQNPFVEPDVIRSRDGVLEATLNVCYAENQIGDDTVYLRSYNGKLVGPTFRVSPGDVMKIKLVNQLPVEPDSSADHNSLHGFNTTNLHTHGLHVSPSLNSDNVLLEIGPQTSMDYEIHIPPDHPAGTFWYHAHKHGSVAAQVASGMSGALIVEGGLDDVPLIDWASERTLVFQQIPYYNEGLERGIVEAATPEGEPILEFLFGPGDWDNGEALGGDRFTTINGVKLPVITIRPGEVQRWRLIDSGFRERIELRIESRNPLPPPNFPSTLTMYEIAADGLALGKIAAVDSLELWPGYRSDVLVKAPPVAGEYLLVDERTPADDSLNGVEENRKYIARLVVEGDPRPMDLPTSEALEGLRLPSIGAEEVTGKQEANYGIFPAQGGGVEFTINGEPYDETRPRVLVRGDVEEWVARSVNGLGVPISHPLHIHVNPFEIFSIRDENGIERLDEPIWRDTIILHEGWTVRFRTRYEDFAGDFVQHCHILDHEDQGMMELIRIRP